MGQVKATGYEAGTQAVECKCVASCYVVQSQKSSVLGTLLDMHNLLSRITIDPLVCHGKPCVRGLRYPVRLIWSYSVPG